MKTFSYYKLLCAAIFIATNFGLSQAKAQTYEPPPLNLTGDGDPASAFFNPTKSMAIHPFNLPDISKNDDKNLYEVPRQSGYPEGYISPKRDTKQPISFAAGIILSPNGPVLTTADQLNNCKTLRISTPNGSQLNAETIAFDPKADLAILTAPIHGAWPIRIRNMPLYNEELETTGYTPQSSILRVSKGTATEQNQKTKTYTIAGSELNTTVGGAVFDGYGDLAGIITHAGQDAQAIPGKIIKEFLLANHISIPVADGMLSPIAKIARRMPNQIVVRVGCFE